MGGFGGSRVPVAETYTITVAVAVGVIVLLLGFPGLDLPWRLGAILALLILLSVNLAVLAGVPKRARDWRRSRRWVRRLNSKSSGLVRDLRPLVDQTHELLFENQMGTLRHVAAQVAARAGASAMEQMGSRIDELASRHELARDLAASQTSWERIPFIEFIRHAGKHFEAVDPVLDECYGIAAKNPADEPTLKEWAEFREDYNQLRGRWEAYMNRIPDAIGLSAGVKGVPARSLPER